MSLAKLVIASNDATGEGEKARQLLLRQRVLFTVCVNTESQEPTLHLNGNIYTGAAEIATATRELQLQGELTAADVGWSRAAAERNEWCGRARAAEAELFALRKTLRELGERNSEQS